MRLFKIKTQGLTLDASPNVNSILSIEDLNIDKISLPILKKSLESENHSRQLNSNDVYSLQEWGRTLVYRNNDDTLLWIIDIDHKDYLCVKRDNLIDEILIS